MSMDCTYPNTSSTFYSNRRSFKYNANIIQVNTCQARSSLYANTQLRAHRRTEKK